jgi:transcriptional regulator of aromatic amino acid metabolism
VKHRLLPVIATLAAALVLPATTAATASTAAPSAATCVSGAEIKQQVSTFVKSLRDDVKSADARHAASAAFVQSVKAARGAKAATPADKAALGQAISALAKQLKSATNVVERKALIAEIQALVDQKKSAATTADDVQMLRSDIRGLGRAIQHRTNTAVEDQQVADFVHNLLAQFNCRTRSTSHWGSTPRTLRR